MTTLSVPLPAHLEEAEEEAVMAVLKAEQEPILRGNLKDLVKKIK